MIVTSIILEILSWMVDSVQHFLEFLIVWKYIKRVSFYFSAFQIAGEQDGMDKVEKIKKLEKELSLSTEVRHASTD